MSVFFLADVLPNSILHGSWFKTLSIFVSINTVLYLTLALIKLLPKIYVSDWRGGRNRRSETRGIYPDGTPEPGAEGSSPSELDGTDAGRPVAG